MADVLYEEGRYQEAEREYREGLLRNPNASAQSRLGNALSAQNKPDEAVAAYREAIRIDPNHADALYHLGLVLRQKGR